MKNLFKTSIIVSAVIIFAACQKQSISPGTNEISGQSVSKGRPVELAKIKTRTIDQEVRNYTYDASGRSLGYAGNMGSQTYEYPDATHVIETPSASDAVNYELNAKGLAIKSTLGANIFQNTYTYNGKKQLTELYTVDNGGNSNVTTFTYVNNNLDKQVTLYNGALTTTITYTYYPDKPNVLDNDVFGETFRGVGSKNLVQTSTTKIEGIATTFVINYSYAFDPQGHVTKVMRSNNGIAMSDIIYTYY